MGQGTTRGDAAVIRLPTARPGQDPDILTEVETWWRQMHDSDTGATGPARLDPRGISRALSDSFIAEPVSQRSLRLRMVGQTVERLAAAPLRGAPLSLLFLPEARPALQTAIGRVLAGTPVRLDLVAPRGPFRPDLRGGLILLPLSGRTGTTARVLGALTTVGDPGRRACRFRIVSAPHGRRTGPQPVLRLIRGGLSDTMR